MRDILDDAAIIVTLALGACAAAFVVGVAAGLFQWGMGLVS